MILLIILLIVLSLLILFIYSACVVASKADSEMGIKYEKEK